MMKVKDIFISRIFQVALFIATVIYTLSFCFWGRGCEDPYYWLHLFQSTPGGGELSGGTIAIGHFWCEIFGYSLLSIRVLGWLCCLLAMCIPYFCIYDSDGWLKPEHIFPLSLTLLIMGYGTFNEFSPGTISFLLLSLTALCLFRYWHNGNIGWIFLLGLFSALSFWCRLPNIVAVPIVFLAIIACCINRKERNCIAHEVVYILSFLIICTVIYYISHGDINILSGNIAALGSENTGSHSISLLIKGIIDDTNVILLYSCFIFFICWLAKQIEYAPSKFWSIVCFVILAIFCVFFLKENIGIHKWFNRNLHMLIISISICMLIVLNYRGFMRGHDDMLLCVDFCYIVLAVLPLGSDTYLLKLFPAVLVPLPFIIKELGIRFDKPVSGLLTITLISVVIVAYAENNISKGYRGTVLSMTETSNIPVLKGVKISKQNVEYINELIGKYESFCDKDNVVFYGDASHFAYAVSNVTRKISHPFFCSPDDSAHINRVINVLNRDKAVLFDFEMHDWDYLHKELDVIGYSPIWSGRDYVIYGPGGAD